MWLLSCVINLSFFSGLVLCAFALASLLFYLAELAEEHSVMTKKIVSYAVYSLIGLHGIFLVFDELPFWNVLIGLISHVTYSSMLAKFPFVPLSSKQFVGSCGMVVVDHINWFRFFSHRPNHISHIISFFLIFVWLVPFLFLITVSVDDFNFSSSSSTNSGYSDSNSVNTFKTLNFRNLLSFFKIGSSKHQTLLPTSSPDMEVEENSTKYNAPIQSSNYNSNNNYGSNYAGSYNSDYANVLNNQPVPQYSQPTPQYVQPSAPIYPGSFPAPIPPVVRPFPLKISSSVPSAKRD